MSSLMLFFVVFGPTCRKPKEDCSTPHAVTASRCFCGRGFENKQFYANSLFVVCLGVFLCLGGDVWRRRTTIWALERERERDCTTVVCL